MNNVQIKFPSRLKIRKQEISGAKNTRFLYRKMSIKVNCSREQHNSKENLENTLRNNFPTSCQNNLIF